MRRETQEEVGINIDRIVYHSSQPWPGKSISRVELKASGLHWSNIQLAGHSSASIFSTAVGPSSKSCELMVGFFAYATSFDIKVDGVELQGSSSNVRRNSVTVLWSLETLVIVSISS